MTWTPRHDRLIQALDAAALLAGVRAAFDLSGNSESADRDLILALRRDPVLGPGLDALEDGEPGVLQRAVHERYPRQLDAGVVHHLALAWSRSADEGTRLRGLCGLFFLLDRQLDYCLEIAAAATDIDTARGALDALPQELIHSDLRALESLASPAEDLDRASVARSRLDGLLAALDSAGVSAELRDRVRALDRDACTAAARALHVLLGARVDDAQTRRVDGERDHLLHVFDPARERLAIIGHRELISTAIVAWTVELGWPLREANEFDALSGLLATARPWADDLAERLAREEAIEHQAAFADFQVFTARTIAVQAGMGRMAALRERRKILVRAHALCPIHRNTRVFLAAVDLDLAEALVRERRAPWAPADAVEEARELLREATALRPEHDRIDEVRTLVDDAS